MMITEGSQYQATLTITYPLQESILANSQFVSAFEYA